jgi:hypothetical protein
MLHSSDGSDENENRKRRIAVERHSDVGYDFGVGPGFQGVDGKHDDRGELRSQGIAPETISKVTKEPPSALVPVRCQSLSLY